MKACIVKYPMDLAGILNFILFLLYSALVLFWTIRYFFLLIYKSKQLEEIHKLEARSAVLRTILKTRIKKKANSIHRQYSKEKILVEEIGPKYDSACSLQFTNSHHFESLLNIMKEVSVRLEQHAQEIERKANPAGYLAKKEQQQKEAAENRKEEKPELNAETEVWRKVFVHEKTSISIIKDLAQTTVELKSKIEIHNSETENEKKHLKVPELINFEKFELICAIADAESIKTAEASNDSEGTNSSLHTS